jgi:hypothetical protein
LLEASHHASRPQTVDRAVTVTTRSCADVAAVEHEEGIMGVLMIECPSTGREVSTGIEMLDIEQLPTVKATIVCSACGRVHEWTKRDAWLAEGGWHYRVFVSH